MAEDEWNTISHEHRRNQHRHFVPNEDDGGDIIVYSPPKKKKNTLELVNKFVLILVGIPGSGKSTFASKLMELAPSKYDRVNQDSLGNRQKCEGLTRRILRRGKIPIIDRCNFNPEQRKHWMDIANEAGVPCHCIIFAYNTEVCIRRCRQRKNHETITSRNASAVVRKIAGMFEVPDQLNGTIHNARRRGGEFFHRIERVSSFAMADALVQKYLVI